MKTIVIFILIWLLADYTSTPPFPEGAVAVEFGPTENAAARKDFERALLLLHNFEYPDARELFRAAQQKDPLFAMAYWGEAMTYNHPVWHNQDAPAGREVLRKYAAVSKTREHELSIRERDLLQSLELLYGEGPKADRDKSYAGFMSGLYTKYKGDHEIAAFYALSLLGMTEGWNTELCNRAAEVAAGILKELPAHPGALHYYIHAEDHPEYAQRAWEQANDYAKVASYSGHALHMPSHIYLALGLWDNVVRSNEVSWQAGVDRKARKGLNNDALNYHGHWWLEYGYLQQGRFERALETLANQLRYTRELPSVSARTHFVIMRGHYLIETNDWQNEVAEEVVKTDGLRIEIRTLDNFVQGAMAFRKGDAGGLEKIIGKIEADISNATQQETMNEGITQCGAALPRVGINQATIMREELQALKDFMKGDYVSARAHFKNAIDLEEENGHFFGPPEILKPTHEFYGDFLLAIGHAELAMASFEKSLEKAPGRNQSLLGLSEASRLAGKPEVAQEAAQKATKNLGDARPISAIKGFFRR